MFRFVVRHLRWLARIPLAPQIFDALLLTLTALFHREKLRAIEALEAAALRLPGVSTTTHRFGGIGFRRDGREFAHIHGNGLLDAKLTRERAADLVAAGRAEAHHVFGPSVWISFRLHTPADCAAALALIAEAAYGSSNVPTAFSPSALNSNTSVLTGNAVARYASKIIGAYSR